MISWRLAEPIRATLQSPGAYDDFIILLVLELNWFVGVIIQQEAQIIR